jgi:hypothetical protein
MAIMEFEAGVFRIDALMIFARRSRSASACRAMASLQHVNLPPDGCSTTLIHPKF